MRYCPLIFKDIWVDGLKVFNEGLISLGLLEVVAIRAKSSSSIEIIFGIYGSNVVVCGGGNGDVLLDDE